MRPTRPRVEDFTNVDPKQMWKFSIILYMRTKEPRVGDKCGIQVWETSEDSCSPKNPEWETSVRDKWETSVNSCGPRQPEWETSVGVKWETSGRQVQAHAAQDTESERQVCKITRPKTPRVGDKCRRQV